MAGASIGGLGVLAEAGAIFGRTASATAEADFFDTLTVTGTGIGTFLIDTSMDVKCKPGTNGANAFIFGSITANGVSSVGSCTASAGPFTISVPAGQTFTLSGQLSASVVSVPGGSDAYALDPFRVFIEPLTPGDGYVSASRVVYPSTPVAATPEPGSFFLISASLLAIAWRAARFRHASRGPA